MCDYAGCNKKAKYEIIQVVGKKQKTLICKNCAPEWVLKLEPITKVYTVRKL